MTRAESTYREACEPAVGFEYPGEGEDTRDAFDRYRVAADLLAFEIVKLHEPKVAMIRLSVLQHMTDPDLNKLPVSKVAETIGMARMTYYRIRAAIGVSLQSLLCKAGT